MTPNEQRILTDFLGQLRATAGVVKDPQAAALIADAVSARPDAAYLLVQRSLLQDQALAAAHERIASLEAQLRAPVVPASSFLESGANAWGRSVTQSGTPVAVAPTDSRYLTSVPAPVVPAPVPASPGLFGGNGGSMLGTMAATAAGVAGGAFLFQGLGNLLGHHGDAAHASGLAGASQANPFSFMTDSVGSSPDVTSAAMPLVDSTSAGTDVADASGASDDSLFGGDDSII